MRKMPFRFVRRVRNLEIKTYCSTKKKQSTEQNGGRGSSSSSSSSSQQFCPSCVLPVVVAFIFGFTVIQLVVIHRTIVAYKNRSLAFEEAYGPSHNDTKSQGDLLAFSKKFDSAWLGANRSRVVEWKPDQSYPYRIPAHYPSPINHIWNKASCPELPRNLYGNISINTKEDVQLDELIRNSPQVLLGGRWAPDECQARFHVALIIPYRFRWNHLKLLLSVVHPILRRQQMSYQVFVAEQFGNYTFNKGLLMNAAFLLALNHSNAFDCVIFHDVDLLPETDTNIYGCANSPAHLSVSIDAYGYRLPYSKLVGGVFAISVKHFIQVNGYSNLYWGWGAEDDDMYKRLIVNQLPLSRPRPDLAKFKMLQHTRRIRNQFINPLIKTARLRFPHDGLTTSHFRLVSSDAQPLYTHFLIDVGQPSYSVLEPNLHLESMIPPFSPPSSTNPLHKNSSSNRLQITTSGDHHHHHQQQQRNNRQKHKRSSPNSPSIQIHHRDNKLTPFPSENNFRLKQQQQQNPAFTEGRPHQNNRKRNAAKEAKGKVERKGESSELDSLLSGIARDTPANLYNSNNNNKAEPRHNNRNNNNHQQQHQGLNRKPSVKMLMKSEKARQRLTRSLKSPSSLSSLLLQPTTEEAQAAMMEQRDESGLSLSFGTTMGNRKDFVELVKAGENSSVKRLLSLQMASGITDISEVKGEKNKAATRPLSFEIGDNENENYDDDDDDESDNKSDQLNFSSGGVGTGSRGKVEDVPLDPDVPVVQDDDDDDDLASED